MTSRGTLGAAVSFCFLLACGSSSDAPLVTQTKTDSVDLLRASLGTASGLFVLTKLDSAAAEAAVTFDHQCTSGHMVNTQRESVTVKADGTARRSAHIDRFLNGTIQTSFDIVQTGTWDRSTNFSSYFLPGMSIDVKLTNANGSDGGTVQYRVGGSTTLSSKSAVGGSCPGSPNDGHEAAFFYSRR